ncbi:hypothetical protein FisN_14Hh146 [Fistulifera solaris]|jgi:hypothetical protein|uniref:FHA domain-containing protein n=1 Tax=Fistulifera solaris TaxID=1519565 RepID=A0A1Z5K8H3_FISSO|nr:hypothetical protein FisN_14Hh146 [Fistulifera solaris]|eukprot:GAX22524.1 hypothetical protein FisN_14Hh146 [Fistulifera solaris]
MFSRRKAAAAVLGCGMAVWTLAQFYILARFSTRDDPSMQEVNRLYYVAQFGLGHRLSKLSAAYHLTRVLNLPVMELHGGSCQTETDVFAYLFGTHRLTMRTSTTADYRNRQILVRNDVAGYAAGQSYKNARVAIPQHYRTGNNNPWKKKLRFDRILFQELLDRFVQRTPLPLLQQFERHTVIGLHVREGNGEQDHFAASGRRIGNTTTFVNDLCYLLRKYAAEQRWSRPALLFLATDTERVIPMVQTACHTTATDYPGIPIVWLPQNRPTQGVSYQAWNHGEPCFQGWQSSMMDMALLAHADVLVAGMRSTFTQILPRALVMGRNKSFCEVHETGRTMTCWDEEESWLFRNLPASTTYSLDNTAISVVHKLLVHLPDVEPNPWIEKARVFLNNTESSSNVFAYGERFDPKYRKQGQVFQKDFTFAAS